MKINPVGGYREGMILALSVTAAALAALGWGEAMHWRASWRRLGHGRSAGRREAVVVLGWRNRGTRANYLNRHRVRAGLRSMDPTAAESVLVLCGGAVGGDVPEAELMERYAREGLGYDGPILLDVESRSTWENIRNAVPLISESESIKIVSDSLHAERGRSYLWMQRPDLAERLCRAEDYRFGEIALVKPVAAALELMLR